MYHRLFRGRLAMTYNAATLHLALVLGSLMNNRGGLTTLQPHSWGLDDLECRFLSNFVRANCFTTVLEFGPGASTEALLDCGCRVCSLEHDPQWLQRHRERLANRAGVELILYQNRPELTVPEIGDRQFDFALVDGPPSSLYQHFSRLNAVEFSAGRTTVLMLHDACRDKERNTLLVLSEKGWRFRILATARGLAIATKGDRAVKWP